MPTTIPALGLGTWKIAPELLPELIPTAVEIGYRHLDCATDYGNEAQVGQGIANALQRGLATREDLWVTSKLWNTDHDPKHVRAACERNLKDLGLDHLDLYLIHFPISLAHVPQSERYPAGWFDPAAPTPKMELATVPLAATWAAMEELVKAGLVREIGISNFNTALITDLINSAATPPKHLQVELHPYLNQPRLRRYCQEHNITVTGYSPFGAGSYVPLGIASEADSVLTDPAFCELAEETGHSPAQLALAWGLARAAAVIPKSSSRERLTENFAAQQIQLTADQLTRIDALDRHQRFNDPGEYCLSSFNTFCPIYD